MILAIVPQVSRVPITVPGICVDTPSILDILVERPGGSEG